MPRLRQCLCNAFVSLKAFVFSVSTFYKLSGLSFWWKLGFMLECIVAFVSSWIENHLKQSFWKKSQVVISTDEQKRKSYNKISKPFCPISAMVLWRLILFWQLNACTLWSGNLVILSHSWCEYSSITWFLQKCEYSQVRVLEL